MVVSGREADDIEGTETEVASSAFASSALDGLGLSSRACKAMAPLSTMVIRLVPHGPMVTLDDGEGQNELDVLTSCLKLGSNA